jgi:SAM-dependent methyltransferase
MLRSVLRRLKPRGGDPEQELRFWVEQWDPHIRAGSLFAPHGLELIGEAEVADSYEGRRWQEARAQVQRVLREAEIDDPDFFGGRVMLEIGPGPVGLPEACGAKVATGAEAIPVLDESVDVVVARNSLDHVVDPAAVLAEVVRVLRPGGTLILNVDVDSEPTAEEPHAFTAEDVRRLVQPLRIERERTIPEPHGLMGTQRVFVATKLAV